MLRRNNDSVHTDRFPVLIVFDRHLGLSVRAEIIERAVLPYFCEAAGELVRKIDRHRHIFGRFVARITEHHALVARAVFRVVLIFARFERFVDAHCDIRRLFVNGRITPHVSPSKP